MYIDLYSSVVGSPLSLVMQGSGFNFQLFQKIFLSFFSKATFIYATYCNTQDLSLHLGTIKICQLWDRHGTIPQDVFRRNEK